MALQGGVALYKLPIVKSLDWACYNSIRLIEQYTYVGDCTSLSDRDSLRDIWGVTFLVVVLARQSTQLLASIGVLLGVLGGAAAPPNCWRSRKFLGCRKFLGVGQRFS